MGRALAVWLPDWPVIASGQQDGAVAVVAGGLVVACSPSARSAGVRRRMRLRGAQSRCPDLRVVERDIAEEVRRFEPVVRRLEEAVMPRLEVIRPGLLAAPARGPARFWGGETQLQQRVVAAVGEATFEAQAGVADTVFAAALAARVHAVVPAGATAAFLAPYPVGVLGQPRLADLLNRLGVDTLGAFAQLPPGRVLARFGTEGAAAHRTARGQEARPLSTRPAGGEYAVRYEFERPEARLEPVVFAAKALAEQLHQRLAAAGVVASRVEVEAELADGRRLSRVYRDEGRLSTLAVAERVRGQLQAWTESGRLDTGGVEGGIAALALRPEGLTAATGYQAALFDEHAAPLEVERAAARVQAMLGHRAVVRVELTGGRGPAERVRRVPYGDVAARRPGESGPWPGRLPAPHPATVFPSWLPARLQDRDGELLAVSGRLALSSAPTRLEVTGYPSAAVTGWAGPWPVLEAWWDRERAHRIARLQLATADGRAWLLVLEHSRWWAEALYG